MSNQKQPHLLSFTLDSWTVLGGKVSVTLVDGVAVLVGRNGAGKSAILEGFKAISSYITFSLMKSGEVNGDILPRILDIEVLTPTERHLRYKYELIYLSDFNDNPDDDLEENQVSFNDSCQYLDGKKEILWHTEQGVTTLNKNGDSMVTILGNTSPLQDSKRLKNTPLSLKVPQEMQWIYEVLRGVRLLGKISIRQSYRPRESSLLRITKNVRSNLPTPINLIADKIFSMETEDLDELQMICQRIGLGEKISIKKFIANRESSGRVNIPNEYIAEVLLDGVNIGLLSDGTLKILSILVDLLSYVPSKTTIIEEPETQIHPAMLASLLNELESYTYGENLILSTHSPQVVSWTSPDKINLVYRHEGKTMVRKLQEGEIEQVVQYLCEEGNLGEWIYSGMLDEDE
ncbi:MAG: AAA family ATPase [Microcystaceae cyanobacterium]